MTSILIIEDDPFVQRFYERLFTQSQFTVYLASSGEEGIRRAHEIKPQLILLDIMMPGINGLETLERLKKDEDTSALQVVMLTNFGDEELVKKCMALGAAGVMVKIKYSPETLVEEISKTYLEPQKLT